MKINMNMVKKTYNFRVFLTLITPPLSLLFRIHMTDSHGLYRDIPVPTIPCNISSYQLFPNPLERGFQSAFYLRFTNNKKVDFRQ